MTHGMKTWWVVGMFGLGMGAAHAEPCFTRDVNGTPVTICTNDLPFALPSGGPGEIRVEGGAAVGQGFGPQAAGATALRGAPAGTGWQGQPGEFGLHGPARVRQGVDLPVATPPRPMGE